MLRRLLSAKKGGKEEEKSTKVEEKDSISSFDTDSIIKAFSGPEIRFEDVDIVEVISQRKNLTVYKAVTFGYEVAVKEIVTKSFRITENEFLRFKQDVKVMSTVHHQNICLFLGACLDSERCILVTELCQQDLEQVISDKKVYSELGLFERLEMAKDIASGMSWLHALGFAHLNLKPKNILVDRHGVLKIADLGASLLLRDNQNLQLETRALEISEDFHVAPEHKKKSKEKYSQAMDVYSFGTILWEILLGFTHEDSDARKEFSKAISSKPEAYLKEKFQKTFEGEHSNLMKPIIELLLKCWQKDPSKRPNFLVISKEIDQLLIECAIVDTHAKQFWVDHFYKITKTKDGPVRKLQTTVTWPEFLLALSHELKLSSRSVQDFIDIAHEKPPEKILSELPPSPKPSEIKKATFQALEKFSKQSPSAADIVNRERKRRTLVTKVMSMRAVMVSKDKSELHILTFGKVSELLGPWKIDMKHGILENISNLTRNSWFYGHMSKDQAYAKLANKDPGTFLLRFGTSQNRFVVSRVSKQKSTDKRVVHNRITFVPGKGFCLPGRAFWPTLEVLVSKEVDLLRHVVTPGKRNEHEMIEMVDHPLEQVSSVEEWWNPDLAINNLHYTDEAEEVAAKTRKRSKSKSEKELLSELKKLEDKRTQLIASLKSPSEEGLKTLGETVMQIEIKKKELENLKNMN